MSRLEVGVHAALEAPIGQINGGNPLNEVVSSAHALGVEVGYRVLPRLYVGVSGQYDFANAVDTPCFGCGYSIRNGAHFIRIETNAEYRFVRSGAIRPWIGSGLGYEILFVTHSFLDQVNSDRWRGIEFLTVAGGVDFRPVERIWVGPFAKLSLGAYNRIRFNRAPEMSVAETLGDDGGGIAMHGWLSFGIRLMFAPLP